MWMDGLLGHWDRKELSKIGKGREEWGGQRTASQIQLRAFPRPAALCNCQGKGGPSTRSSLSAASLLFQPHFGSPTRKRLNFLLALR
jgi:hypothetical protein